jgi:two-component system, NarL family, invasion response regulator UvrY
MPDTHPMRLALVDDHKLFRRGLVSLLEVASKNFTILFEADNGLDMKQKINPLNQPDIILMDVNMPGMDGFASVLWLSKNFPDIKVLVISMIEREESVVRMLKLGVRGYLCKDVEPKELGDALNALMKKGYYYTDFVTGKLVHILQNNTEDYEDTFDVSTLTEKEKNFILLCCSELTYGEMAAKMYLSPKTIDSQRHSIFEKLKVKNRIGLVLFAIRNGLFNV